MGWLWRQESENGRSVGGTPIYQKAEISTYKSNYDNSTTIGRNH